MPEQLETSAIRLSNVSRSKKDGLYLSVLGAAVFLLFGFALQISASDSREDFRAVVNGSRCLLHNCDPYNQQALFKSYELEYGRPEASHYRSHTLTQYVNLPATALLTAPLAMLTFKMASLVWSLIIAASFILASFLIWDISSRYAPVLSASLIAISLSSGAIVLANGNPAGIVVAFCVIAVWCFLKDRLIWAGVLCLSVSFALKPHDAGFVWLYFLLANGKLRIRALQVLAFSALFSFVAVLWISRSAPNWLSELRTNMSAMEAHGANNDPGPDGPTSRDRAIEAIVSLQSAVSLIQDDPIFYNAVTLLICGIPVLMWAARVFIYPLTIESAWLAIAAIVPLTMIVTYHRAYDTRLLILAVPACAILAAEKGRIGKFAVVATTLGIALTSEMSFALIRSLLSSTLGPAGTSGLLAKLATRTAPLACSS